jgi:coenzyme F420 hydrogenase subunit beta
MVEEAAGLAMEERKYVRLPTFLERGFSDLNREVVTKRICCLCGTCAAFCDKITITEEGEKAPEFSEDYDTVCGLCYTLCPRIFLPLSELERRIFGAVQKDVLGVYRSCYAVRSKKGDITGQDGGTVTALLAYALEEGVLDCAVITAADDQWRPKTKIATNYDDLKAGAGTKYTLYPSVIGVREAIEAGHTAIGFVGLPCQIQGLRKVQTTEQPYDVGIDKLKLLIGLFCMENFREELLDYIAKKYVKLEHVSKCDIKGKDFSVYAKEKYNIPLVDIEDYVGDGCSVCMDFTAELADISVGSVGSEDGWSTVFVRSERGEELLKGALDKGYIEVKEIEDTGFGLIRRLAERKKASGMARSE